MELGLAPKVLLLTDGLSEASRDTVESVMQETDRVMAMIVPAREYE